MSRCVSVAQFTEQDDPFGAPYGRPRAASKGSKCGGSVEGTALSTQCAEGALSLSFTLSLAVRVFRAKIRPDCVVCACLN